MAHGQTTELVINPRGRPLCFSHFAYFYWLMQSASCSHWLMNSISSCFFKRPRVVFFKQKHSARYPLGRPLFFPCCVFSLADAVCLVFSLAVTFGFPMFFFKDHTPFLYPLGDLSVVFFLSCLNRALPSWSLRCRCCAAWQWQNSSQPA